MTRIGIAVGAATLVVCGIALAKQQQGTSMWSDEEATAARTVVEQGLAAVERLDPEGLKALCTADIVAFDIDFESKPVRMGSLDDAIGYVAGMCAETEKMGAKVSFENVKSNCRATSNVGYCILEYNFAATTADGTRMVQPSQTTVVLTKADGAWKWAHWHTSLSAAPTSAGSE